MTNRIVAAFASFGPFDVSNALLSAEIFMLRGDASAGSLDDYRFRFVDGQELKPGARGAIRMTFPEGQSPSLAGPLPLWAGRIIGHVWGLRLVPAAGQPPSPTTAGPSTSRRSSREDGVADQHVLAG